MEVSLSEERRAPRTECQLRTPATPENAESPGAYRAAAEACRPRFASSETLAETPPRWG